MAGLAKRAREGLRYRCDLEREVALNSVAFMKDAAKRVGAPLRILAAFGVFSAPIVVGLLTQWGIAAFLVALAMAVVASEGVVRTVKTKQTEIVAKERGISTRERENRELRE